MFIVKHQTSKAHIGVFDTMSAAILWAKRNLGLVDWIVIPLFKHGDWE